MGVRERLQSLRKIFGPPAPEAFQIGEEAAGMTPSRPFSPGEPIAPYDGYARNPRTRDFVTGYNINARPRSHERVPFDTLRSLIEAYDVAQMAIWHRIDSIRSLEWSLVAADGYEGDVTDAIAAGMQILESPDRENDFSSWQAAYLYDILAYDAGTLYRMRNRGGQTIGLRVIDGTAIAPLQDYWGNVPSFPAEAYVQYINGLPWNWLTTRDIIYRPFRKVAGSPYGKAPLESILLNANTDLRFQAFFLQHFTQGNIPAAFASAPETWTPQQIEQFQTYWDAFILGDQAAKAQIKWIPGGSRIEFTQDREFSDAFSLHLMRKTLAAYHVVPSDMGFTQEINKSSGETQSDVQHRVGDVPLAKHLARIVTGFLQSDIHLPIKFVFDFGEEQDDRLQTAQADKVYWEMGAIGPSEIRQMRYGLTEAGTYTVPRSIYTTRGGPIPLSALDAVAGSIDLATAAPAENSAAPHRMFRPVQGVVPVPPIEAEPLAEQMYGPAAVPAAPPQLVGKEGAPAAGITAATGVYGYDGPGTRPGAATGDDETDDTRAEPADVAKGADAEIVAFHRYVKQTRRTGRRWRDFQFAALAPEAAAQLNATGRTAALAKQRAGDDTPHEIDPDNPGPIHTDMARSVYEQLADDYPTDKLGWVLRMHWAGPVAVPVDSIDFSGADDWQASHEPGKVSRFADKIQRGKLKPVILVNRPGKSKSMVVDGHHRSLAYRSLGRDVLAYVGDADRRDGPWDELHSFQRTGHGSSGADLYRAEAGKRKNTAKSVGAPVAAGLAAQAADTGRVLMLQRAQDDDDPAAGAWEFPGGRLENGESPLGAAAREWQEETGMLLPVGDVTGTWTSPDGVYAGYVWTVPAEDDIPIFDSRDQVANPDDPDGDDTEALAWWDPDQLPGNPAVRAELLADLDRVTGALGAGLAKAAHPKGDAPAKGAAHWPGWEHDHRAAGYWTPRIAAATESALNATRATAIAAGYLAAHPEARDDNADRKVLIAAAAVHLAGQRIDFEDVLGETLGALLADGYLIGAASAIAVLDNQRTDLGGWEPGDTTAANNMIGTLGQAVALGALLGTVQAAVRRMAATRLDDLAKALADAAMRGDGSTAAGRAMRAALADASRATAVAVTEITRASSTAAMFTYTKRGVTLGRWVTDFGNVCPKCLANAAAGPVPIGQPYPSGASNAPQHPSCRCAVLPVT